MLPHDPDGEKSLAIVIFDNEDDYRKGDEILSNMDAGDTPGRRTSVTKHDVAMRTRERDNGKQIQLWSDLDYTVQAFVTNDWTAEAEDIAFEYDGRAEVEPAIGELKSGWGIGKIPSQDFRANHAVFLLKLLAHNLMRRFVRWAAPHLSTWRVPWLRRALINIPGRLLRSGRRWTLRVPPKSSLRLD